jgi:hemerythrin-like domain-containing protein
MEAFDLMIREHGMILRMLRVMRQAAYRLTKTGEIDYDDFYAMADFVKVYADDHHHGKEEKILFNRMVTELGDTGRVIIQAGMLVEHDLGRFHMAELMKALEDHRQGRDEAVIDILANAVGYANLLARHIDKENHMVYPFARRELSEESLKEIDEECRAFEDCQTERGIQDRYGAVVEALESGYLDLQAGS